MSAQLKALTIQNGTTRRILDASSLEVGNGVNSAAGQALTILSSDGVGAAGYNISMTAGLGDTLFRGGAVSVVGGHGGASDGSGTATGGNGGAIVLFTGTGGAATAIGDTSGDGGNIAVAASNAGTSVSGAIGGNGGRVTIFAGSASRTPGVAGTVQIMAGSANYVTGAGGDASLMGGQPGSGGVGGNAVVVGGSPFGLGTGGDATISGGSAFSGVGGNVRLDAGTGTAVGNIFIGNGDACPIYLGNASVGSIVDIQDFTANAAANAKFYVGAAEMRFNNQQTHSIKVQDSATATVAGKHLQLLGAWGNTTGAGGRIDLTAGGAPGGGLGGNIQITSGNSAGSTAGNIDLLVGSSGSGVAGINIATFNSALVTIGGAYAQPSGVINGQIDILSQIKSARLGFSPDVAHALEVDIPLAGNGQDLSLLAGPAAWGSVPAVDGGVARISGGTAGTGVGGGLGGGVVLTGGASSISGKGGNIALTGGASADDTGGAITLAGGTSSGATGGSVTIHGGDGLGLGTSTWGTVSIGTVTTKSVIIEGAGDAAFAIDFRSSGASQMQLVGTSFNLQATATFNGTAGMVNLPNNFKINNVSTDVTGATGVVTATALNAITQGTTSNGDPYHTHPSLVPTTVSNVTITGFANQAIVVGAALVMVDGTTATRNLNNSDASAVQTDVVGLATTAGAPGASISVMTCGICAVPIANAIFASTPVAANRGKRVYAATASGELTLTAPSGNNQLIQKVGTISGVDATYVYVNVQIGDQVLIPA
jgi:hypothetical protein